MIERRGDYSVFSMVTSQSTWPVAPIAWSMCSKPVFVQRNGLRQAGGGLEVTTAEAVLAGEIQRLQRRAFRQSLAAQHRQEIHLLQFANIVCAALQRRDAAAAGDRRPPRSPSALRGRL